MSACVNRQAEVLVHCMQVLRSRGQLDAIIQAVDDHGCTAVHFAAASGASPCQDDPTCMVMVLDAGGSVNGVDNSGFTPLIIAAQNGFPSIVKVLLHRPDTDLHATVDGQDALRLSNHADVRCMLTTMVSAAEDGSFFSNH